jgi:PKD repeat protein
VALIWNAAPCLRGDVPTTKQIMMETAESKISAQCPPFVDHPNDVWGWGILDELAAVQAAQAYCTPCDPPTNAAFAYDPASPYAGDTVTFLGSAAGTEPITYDWTFGDGGTASGQSVTHTYATAGAYTVTMTASNACGQQAVQQSITVQPLIVLHLNKAKMNWAAAARPGLYKIVYSGRVHDQSHAIVPGVLVTGVYTYPDNSQLIVTYTTTNQGQFKFPIKAQQTGVYTLCVTNMQKTGYVFDPNYGEWPACMSVTVTP